ncbi:hypothetical protein FQN54_003416 [Arachnomyces sp. PD_36]|nr:hypothetical protein FQN54_003416 [Arachnomyces sp. PD_36]
MPGIRVDGFDAYEIYDIRQDSSPCIDLRGEIIKGLKSQPKTLPGLLLWDDNGQQLFDVFSQTPTYYPFHSEVEILDHRASEIAGSVPEGSALIELGCGTVRKTKSILSALNKQGKYIHYFAVDVSLQGLSNSIMDLTKAMEGSKFVKITGLLGTYDDCVSWLSNPENLGEITSVNMLWMGNSIANVHYSEASAFLSRFRKACEHSGTCCQFLVSVDICQEFGRVSDAYSYDLPEFREFMSNGMWSANSNVGQEIFHSDDWVCDSEFDSDAQSLDLGFIAKRDVEVNDVEGSTVSFQKGEKVNITTTGKWTEATMKRISMQAGFTVQRRWKDDFNVYGEWNSCSKLSLERQS